MKKNFVVVLIVVFLLSMLTCEAENEPMMIPSTATTDVFGEWDAADFLQPNAGEVLFVSVLMDIVTDIVSENINLNTDKLTMSSNIYIGYDYDAPSTILFNYFNNDGEFVLIEYASDCNTIIYSYHTPDNITPAYFDILGDLIMGRTYDEWRKLDADVVEYLFEAVNTALSE